jgi:hypothetical protein
MNLIDDVANDVLIAIFELPGLGVGDLTLELQNGNLIVKGERRLSNSLIYPQRSTGRGDLFGANPQRNAQETLQPTVLSVDEIRCGVFYRAIPVAAALQVSEPPFILLIS